jgi:hypothetical protein
MHLLVRPVKDGRKPAAKLWRLDYRFNGRRKTLALGRYPEVTLEDARERRAATRKLLANDIDPADAKKRKQLAEIAIDENTFKRVALDWHAAKKAEWTEETAEGKLRRLEHDLFPHLGDRPTADIEPPDLPVVLRRIRVRGKGIEGNGSYEKKP